MVKMRAPVAPLRAGAATKKVPAFAFATRAGARIVARVEPTETFTTTTTEPAPEPWTPHTLVAGYPLWLVAVVGCLALVLVFWLLARAFRLLAALVALAAVAAASWVAWQHVFG